MRQTLNRGIDHLRCNCLIYSEIIFYVCKYQLNKIRNVPFYFSRKASIVLSLTAISSESAKALTNPRASCSDNASKSKVTRSLIVIDKFLIRVKLCNPIEPQNIHLILLPETCLRLLNQLRKNPASCRVPGFLSIVLKNKVNSSITIRVSFVWSITSDRVVYKFSDFSG